MRELDSIKERLAEFEKVAGFNPVRPNWDWGTVLGRYSEVGALADAVRLVLSDSAAEDRSRRHLESAMATLRSTADSISQVLTGLCANSGRQINSGSYDGQNFTARCPSCGWEGEVDAESADPVFPDHALP